MVPDADRVHEPELEKLPPLVSELNDTVPVGVVCPLEVLSVTVAVQLLPWPTATLDGEQDRPVVVVPTMVCEIVLLLPVK